MKKKTGTDVYRKDTQPKVQTPYEARERDKYTDDTACPECGAVS